MKVPPVEGLTRDVARRAIERAKLTFKARGDCGEGSPDFERPTCLARASSPAAGTPVDRGHEVVVTFSDETLPPDGGVPVPSLEGLTLIATESALKAAGLVLAADGACDVDTPGPTTSPYCQVESQDPPAGKRVLRGTEVTATFGWNPPPTEKTKVPVVRGMFCTQAKAAITKALLDPIGCEQSGNTVISTLPAEGTTVDVGTRTFLDSAPP